MGDLEQRATDFVESIDRGELTARNALANLRHFFTWLHFTGTTDPKRADVVAYREWLLSEHVAIIPTATGKRWTYRTDTTGGKLTTVCKPLTVRNYLQTLAQFFKWTDLQGVYPDITKGVRLPAVENVHRRDSLEPVDVLTIEQGIRAHAQGEQGARLLAMFLLAVNCGLRTCELSRANVGDMETRGGRPFLKVQGKGHQEADARKALALPVYNAVLDYLKVRHTPQTPTSPLFVATGNRSGGQRLPANTISRLLKVAMQEAGYNSDRLTAHSLRHTTAYAVMDITDNNIYDVQMYLRHESPRTTELYLDRHNERMDADIADRLWQRYHRNDCPPP